MKATVFRRALTRYLPAATVQALRRVKNRLRSQAMGGSHTWIDDETWFELQFRPEKAREEYGIPLPGLPPDEVQSRFNARSGRVNLQQAFSFYRYVCGVCQWRWWSRPHVLDFGGGWGRISRFFLRDTNPQSIVIADCMSEVIHWLEATGNPCRIIQNGPLPPIVGLRHSFHLIYAFSVFSHLSEECFHAWIAYLMDCLRPHGFLVFTTRGKEFIAQLEQLHREASPFHTRVWTQLATVTGGTARASWAG